MICVKPENIKSTDFKAGAMLLVDKPADWTSFDVVNKVRGALRGQLGIKKIKVGHSGTLDPAATGLLVICTGKWTKKLYELQGLDKCYTGVIKLGETTASYDAESDVIDTAPWSHLTIPEIALAARAFEGEIAQVPPIYSAVKIDGRRAYTLARRGKEVKLEARQVIVHSFGIVAGKLPEIHFEVHCGKGTYIRSLAHDLGQTLGCGAHLQSLCRTQIGEFDLSNAWPLDKLIEGIHSGLTT